jgi:hypothetical protein
MGPSSPNITICTARGGLVNRITSWNSRPVSASCSMPGIPPGVGVPGGGQPERIADHQLETWIQGRKLDEDLSLVLASVPA